MVFRAVAASPDLAASFAGSRYFEVRQGHDRREFEDALVIGEVRGIIVIPDSFASDFAARKDFGERVAIGVCNHGLRAVGEQSWVC